MCAGPLPCSWHRLPSRTIDSLATEGAWDGLGGPGIAIHPQLASPGVGRACIAQVHVARYSDLGGTGNFDPLRRGGNIGNRRYDRPSDHRHHHQHARYPITIPTGELRAVDEGVRADVLVRQASKHRRRSRAENRRFPGTNVETRKRIPRHPPTTPLLLNVSRTMHERGVGDGSRESGVSPTATAAANPTPAGRSCGGTVGPERAIFGGGRRPTTRQRQLQRTGS
mmetsp:Transcript_13801/g.39633  ORF Transcript_13801/g.39633 Transcript_13801/m.39633 type:complete len:225 (-) Transcript_13801:92-766(-)